MQAVSFLGATPGFEVETFGNLPVAVPDEAVGFSTSELEVRGNASAYVISRWTHAGKILTWIGYYRAAEELGGNRRGAFHGAGIWLVDKGVRGVAAVNFLPLLAAQVEQLAMQNGQFVRSVHSVREQIVWPQREKKQVDQSIFEMPPSTGLEGGTLPRLCLDLTAISSEEMAWFIDWVQTASLFRRYGRVFLSRDVTVINSARVGGDLLVADPMTLLLDEMQSSALSASQAKCDARATAELRRRLAELEQENCQLTGEVDRLRAACQNAQKQNDQALLDSNKLKIKLSEAESAGSYLKGQLRESQDSIYRLQSEISRLRNNVACSPSLRGRQEVKVTNGAYGERKFINQQVTNEQVTENCYKESSKDKFRYTNMSLPEEPQSKFLGVVVLWAIVFAIAIFICLRVMLWL
jgi:hypothetical protein